MFTLNDTFRPIKNCISMFSIKNEHFKYRKRLQSYYMSIDCRDLVANLLDRYDPEQRNKKKDI